MNVNEQEKRLEDIFRKNNNKGFAVAITGCWGIGKTFFWNNFFKEKTQEENKIKGAFYYEASKVDFTSAFENKKYAYISLFGMESMQDLKNAICTKLSTNPYVIESAKKLEFSLLLKKSLEQFKDIKVSQYGVSASAKLLENLLYAQVKDAIICFDDFERLSEKLKIQDVMGLANQLKLERNCQVILILDESKNDEENKKKYAEYKEKLIDETIKITSVEPLIRENAQDIDEQLVDLMVKFANELEIHNFRFFQKIIKLYKQFREQLPNEVAYSTKEIILVRILQGYLVEDFGESLKVQWNDFPLKRPISLALNNEYKADEEQIKEPELFNKIRSFSNILAYSMDEWLIEFKKWFEQRDILDFEKMKVLVESDLISDEKLIINNEFHQLFHEFWNCRADSTFIECFFNSSLKNIGIANLGNIDFAITILEKLGAIDESKKLEEKVREWIAQQLEYDRKAFRGINAFGQGEHRFGDYIKSYFQINPLVGLPSVIDSINAYLIIEQWSEEHEIVVNQINKEDLKQFVEVDYFKDARFINIPLISLVEKFPQNLKNLFKEILEEKKKLSDFHSHYFNFLISRIDK